MELRYETQPDHLLVVVGGSFDAEATRAAFVEVFRLCRERGIDRVLVDARAIRELVPIADRFELAKLVAAANPPRIAILVTEENAVYTRTFENTAVNRGAPVKTTGSEAEARSFLGIAAR